MDRVPRTAALVTVVALVTIAAGTLIALAVGGAIDDRTTPLVLTVFGFVATTVPALVAAAFAERASRDIRNGVVVAKAKEGSRQALAEESLVDKAREGSRQALREEAVVTREGPAIRATLEALNAQTAALTTLVGAYQGSRAGTEDAQQAVDQLRQATTAYEAAKERRTSRWPGAQRPEGDR